MPRIKSANRCQAYCKKHGFCKHIEYVFYDSPSKYVCYLCKSDTPYAYSIYGRKQPGFKPDTIDECKKQQYGRQVA